MFANQTKIRFRPQVLARGDTGSTSSCSNVGAIARRGAVVRRRIGCPILVCQWVAVGGQLECRWSIEISDGSPLEEPKSSRWVHRIGCFFDVKRSRYRLAVPAVA